MRTCWLTWATIFGLPLTVAGAGADDVSPRTELPRECVLEFRGEDDDQPLADVEVVANWGGPGGQGAKRLRSGKDGQVILELPRDVAVVIIDARIAGRVPWYGYWSSENHELDLPEFLAAALSPAVTIRGQVRDAAGQPVAGAAVEARIPATRSEWMNFVFSIGKVTTGLDGVWQFDNAPQALMEVTLSIDHPDYQPERSSLDDGAALVDGGAVIVLRQGPSLSGRISTADGKPVAGATVTSRSSLASVRGSEASTDDAGQFTLKNCEPGPVVLTVQAEGFAPHLHETMIVSDSPAVELRLQPGAVIRGRIVDAKGRPIPKAMVAASTWRGQRSLRYRVSTDEDGRFVWTSAPHDEVQFDFGKLDYMYVRNHPVIAGGEQVITLPPELVAHGIVVDARTGAPLKEFQVVHGVRFPNSPRPHWPDKGARFSEGKFTYRIREPAAEHFLRVEAEGYQPAFSPGFADDAPPTVQEFELTPVE